MHTAIESVLVFRMLVPFIFCFFLQFVGIDMDN
uniref:Uncharacterized protein n=1 Tax=Rhizophora mucronata TaxID=61149 RepID=A0A2P2PVE2_RHIMU